MKELIWNGVANTIWLRVISVQHLTLQQWIAIYLARLYFLVGIKRRRLTRKVWYYLSKIKGPTLRWIAKNNSDIASASFMFDIENEE